MSLEDAVTHAVDENRARWDELVPIHCESDFYGVDRFLQGETALQDLEVRELGDVCGRRVLHLQCHFGLGTLSLARLGAIATGVDFSAIALDVARAVCRESNASADFVLCDVHALHDGLVDFDYVFCSYGILLWLHDLASWAQSIYQALRPGGVFYIVDDHPLASALEGGECVSKLRFANPYFFERSLRRIEITGSYADRSAQMQHRHANIWSHGMGEVVTALARAGLRIEFLREHPYSPYQIFGGMTRVGRVWKLSGSPEIPLLFSIRATK